MPSTNHASPSGALPFLLPPTSAQSSTTESKPAPALKPTIPLTGSKIERYAKDHSSYETPADSSSRIEAYEALLSQSLRPAWVRTPLETYFQLPLSRNRLTQAIYTATHSLPRSPHHPPPQIALSPPFANPPAPCPLRPPRRRHRRDPQDHPLRHHIPRPAPLRRHRRPALAFYPTLRRRVVLWPPRPRPVRRRGLCVHLLDPGSRVWLGG